MEVILDCFFDKVFSDLDRGCLMARYKRKQMVDYFSTVIGGCCKGEEGCNPQLGCKKAVQAAINFHNATRDNNGEVCLLGKYHNILYVAAKLCYDFKLEDNETVVNLLKNIFVCERTFERLMIGAIFGTRVTHLISGWKSDFNDRKECLNAIEYFLDHAAKAKLMFNIRGELKCMAEVPMESYSRATPAKVCIQAGQSDVLSLLLKYGSVPHEKPDHCGLQLLLRHLQTLAEEDIEKPLPIELLNCLNIYIKGLPRVPKIIEDPTRDDEPIVVHAAILSAVPYDRTGYYPPDLKHLCRCVIRHKLAINGQLPYGAMHLNLPPSLQDYINLEEIK
ncbi:SOCS domain-containing protein stops [Lycorma delicatula]|uniref:SOCS domain-containing protein stops n=1 Tax=Lycorma delicatula TaxID=130591 RepID=UPI003F51940D